MATLRLRKQASVKSLSRALIIAMALGSPPAQASFSDGNEILQRCTSISEADSQYCAGYMAAITDVYPRVSGYEGQVCISPAVSLLQVRDVVVNFLREQPEIRHYVAPSVILEGLAQAFPC